MTSEVLKKLDDGKIDIAIIANDCDEFKNFNVNFVKDGPNVRRKNINMVLSQFSYNYVKLLQNYNAILKKRNQFLKSVDCCFDSQGSVYVSGNSFHLQFLLPKIYE
jgi:hypothetical protein